MDISTATCLGYLLAHVLIEHRHNLVAMIILHISSMTIWYQTSFWQSYTKHKDVDTTLLCLLGCFKSATLMVLSICNDNYRPAHIFLLRETTQTRVYGTAYVCSLCGNKRWRKTLKEHLCRYKVGGYRQLHEGAAGKDNKSDLVVLETVYHILYQHLAFVQTGWCNIFRKHRVTDIESNHSLYSVSLLVAQFRASLRTGKDYYQQGKYGKRQYELYYRTHLGAFRHQSILQITVCQTLQKSSFPSNIENPYSNKYRYQYQEIQIYRISKSHNFIQTINIVTLSWNTTQDSKSQQQFYYEQYYCSHCKRHISLGTL